MLKALRDGAKSGFLKYILLGFLVLAGGGLVLTDVGGFFRGGVSNNLVAKGKNIEITTMEFDRIVRRILSNQGLSPQDAYQRGMIHDILSRQIREQLITLEAQKIGLQANDEMVTQQISKLAAPFATGDVSKKQAVQQILRSQGVSEGEFINAIRQEMSSGLFRQALFPTTMSISKQQAQDLYQFRYETRDFDGFVFRTQDVKGVTSPSDEQLESFYNARKADFLISEKRSITIATLTPEILAKKIKITEEELQEEYEAQIATFTKAERRTLEQAVLSTEKEAQDIADKAKTNNNLKQAVKDVTGEDSAYLGENEHEFNTMLKDLFTPAFAAKKGDVIGPIETDLGWHVVIMKGVIPPEIEPFNKVKKQLKVGLLQARLMNELEDAANTLDDRLASGEDLSDVAKDMGLPTRSFKDMNQAGTNSKGKNLLDDYAGDKAQILEAAFDFDEGESAPVMQLNNGNFITLRIDDVQARSFEPLNKVKAALKKQWVSQQKKSINKARAEDALEMLKAGKTLQDISKEIGMTSKNFKKLSQMKDPAKPMNKFTVSRIFSAEKDVPLSLISGDDYIVGKITNTQLPDIKGKDKEIAKIQEEASSGLPQESIMQYLGALSDRYNVQINNRVLKRVYGPDLAEQ